MLAEAEKSKGTFYYEAPDKVRWEYDSPTPKVIVINGEERWSPGTRTSDAPRR